MKRTIVHITLVLLSIFAVLELNASNAVPNLQKNIQSGIGLLRYPVLLVEFEDVKFTVEDPKAAFNALLNGGTGSAAEYFNSNFSGICTFEFCVGDVIKLPYPISLFGARSGTFNDTDVKRLLREACRAASEGGLDFSEFDMDADGIVDNVALIFAGHSESEGGGADAIWPHQQDVINDNIVYNGVKIASYSCTSELRGGQGDSLATIGVFCHEFAHSLGLPDIYDTNGEMEGLSPALYGTLSIMDKGNHLDEGRTPPFFNAIEREILGIGEIVDLVPDTSYVIPPVSISHTIYRVKTSNEGEYFLFEYRNRSRWDRYIGGSGLVAYHVDKSDKVYGGLASSQRWKYNNINTFAPHECARVLTAAVADADIGALFYPGAANVVELTSNGGYSRLRDWDGNAVGIGLTDIRISGSRICFNTIRDYSFNDTLPRPVEFTAMAYQNDARLQWQGAAPGSLPEGVKEQWLVSWKKEGEQQPHSMVSDSSGCCIYGLEPGCRYSVQVRCMVNKEFGEPVGIEIETEPLSSVYPYIFVKHKGYKKGDVMDLRIFNLVEVPHSAQWRINGERVEEDYFEIGEEEKLDIVLTIKYKDGSEENIYKSIKVH